MVYLACIDVINKPTTCFISPINIEPDMITVNRNERNVRKLGAIISIGRILDFFSHKLSLTWLIMRLYLCRHYNTSFVFAGY